MADYTEYPTGDTLKAWIQGTGFDPDEEPLSLIDWDAKMEAVKSELLEKTGYDPFLGETVDSTQHYNAWDVRRGVLNLNGGLWSFTSLSVGGTAKTEGTDFILERAGKARSGKPFVRIVFINGYGYVCPPCDPIAIPSSGAGAITVVGKAGYSETLPGRIWEAMLQKGASLAHTQIALSVSGGRASIKADEVALDFQSKSRGGGVGGGGPLSSEKENWETEWATAIRQYKR